MKEVNIVVVPVTRQEAIENGVLVDVTDTARKVGIKYPVAIEKIVWDRYINGSDKLLHEVLWIFRLKSIYETNSLMRFVASFGGELVYLWAVCGPGDNMEPVVTIMLQ